MGVVIGLSHKRPNSRPFPQCTRTWKYQHPPTSVCKATTSARGAQQSALVRCPGRYEPNRILTNHDTRRAIGSDLHQWLSEAFAGDLRPYWRKRQVARAACEGSKETHVRRIVVG